MKHRNPWFVLANKSVNSLRKVWSCGSFSIGFKRITLSTGWHNSESCSKSRLVAVDLGGEAEVRELETGWFLLWMVESMLCFLRCSGACISGFNEDGDFKVKVNSVALLLPFITFLGCNAMKLLGSSFGDLITRYQPLVGLRIVHRVSPDESWMLSTTSFWVSSLEDLNTKWFFESLISQQRFPISTSHEEIE